MPEPIDVIVGAPGSPRGVAETELELGPVPYVLTARMTTG